MSQLHYYRCIDCLSVATAEDYKPRGECGTCGGALEYMGRVQADRLVKTTERCKCDGRCIFAKGPNCDCKCCGDNHGSGWFGGGFEIVTTDKGPVPRLRMVPSSTAAAIAAEWRAGWYALVAAEAQACGNWQLHYRLSGAKYKARKSRCHRNRMAIIREALPTWQPTERPELQAALF